MLEDYQKMGNVSHSSFGHVATIRVIGSEAR